MNNVTSPYERLGGEQVLRQLRNKKIKVVFDLTSQSANMVVN